MISSNKSIIVLAEDEFEDMELLYPVYRLREEGINVTVVGSGNKDVYTGKHGHIIDVDESAIAVNAEEYDGIIIPGGSATDKLRGNIYVKNLVADMAEKGKLLACICHGPSVLISAKVIKGYKLTCVESIIEDVVNAGGEYMNAGNYVDRNLISARIPGNIPQFMRDVLGYLNNQM